MRHTLIAWGILLGLIFFTSCVPQKKLILLQENPEIKNQGNADELLKTISLQKPIYTLEAGDVLSLKVQSTTPDEYNFLNTPSVVSGTDDPVLSGYTIDAAGDILLPVVGRVQVAGLTMPEARDKVTEALKPFLADPTVNLRLLTFRYTMIGEVSRQGQFTTYQDDFNLLEAIASAGGFSDYANRGRVRLIRYEEGKAKLYNFSLLNDNTLAMSNFYLRPDDMIIVDPLPAKFFRENVLGTFSLGFGIIASAVILFTRINN
ncbi:polysaccharide biosynthesis/export family protein [Pontibacter akesuensis]|uniref:Polysaccharide export outer membrane protein n=1 Tax=Pontibacter akesuensis TaxID=388950 RepID=A0A1I7G6U5_9BACT|nr:polysaccharide biosynthesis/export family protein [Pontibacter akesuensis]GHA58452.1 sugar transporter [Pontibacter akesuensis]SFU44174.1 polysaccharide export outer membrane protein [Pontibacter akesuensis]